MTSSFWKVTVSSTARAAPAASSSAVASARPPHDVEELVDTHAELVSQILQEKEDLILAHRQQIDDMMEVVKQEMRLLHSVDQPGSVVDEYVAQLDGLLESKMRIIRALSGRLSRFKDQLEREETLSKSLERSLPPPSSQARGSDRDRSSDRSRRRRK